MINKNKQIALFMGGKTSDMATFVDGYQNIWLPVYGFCVWHTIENGKGKILEYHKSWDWLIPVIDKINTKLNIKIDINTNDFNDTYNRVVECIEKN